MASGVVVSRKSPGIDEFNSGSLRSKRNEVSPILRAYAVTDFGPPNFRNNIFIAKLSL